jgi:FkbM family methyltransferase
MENASYNRNYALQEFRDHGETWMQHRFAGKFKTIFDVGANIGEWTNMTRSYHPNADIHMFEIVPHTYRRLLDNIEIDNKMYPNSFGLLDQAGPVPMRHKTTYDTLSTIVTDVRLDDSVPITGLAFTGDQYVQSRCIDRIDYLKIDTEGAEGKVFRGFYDTFKKGKVGIVQFEYSFICVLTKWMLIDSYKFFEPLGFKLGRLGLDHIEFHEYTLIDEDFKGPEYIAVHESSWKDFGL